MVEMFVRTKHKIDKSHEFALVVVNDDSAWVRGVGGNTGTLVDLRTGTQHQSLDFPIAVWPDL